jgi:chorismate-pyruvate lyase
MVQARGKELRQITLGEDFKVSKAVNTVMVGAVTLEHTLEKLTNGENPLGEILSSQSPSTSSSILNIVEFLAENAKIVEGTGETEEH